MWLQFHYVTNIASWTFLSQFWFYCNFIVTDIRQCISSGSVCARTIIISEAAFDSQTLIAIEIQSFINGMGVLYIPDTLLYCMSLFIFKEEHFIQIIYKQWHISIYLHICTTYNKYFDNYFITEGNTHSAIHIATLTIELYIFFSVIYIHLLYTPQVSWL